MSKKKLFPSEWAKDAIWYQIFPERFRNGDKSNDKYTFEKTIPGWKIKKWGSDWYSLDKWEQENFGDFYQSVHSRRYGGDLQGIMDKLDYLKSLGVSGLYLNPVFRSPSAHKYDASCFHHIEETFGPDPAGDRKQTAYETENPETWVWTSADKLFLNLINEVHKRKMKIIIDGAFNHSGRTFFAFQDILKNKKKSKYVGWYRITNWDSSLKDGFDYSGWFGHSGLPEFRRTETNIDAHYKKYVFDITKRWLAPDGNTENGIDGWRLDAANCLPHGFWKQWRKVVKEINPETYITGEIFEIAPEYLQGDEFDALMNYPFASTVSEFFIDRKNKISVSEFDKRLKQLRDAYPDEITFYMQNLVSSHDTPRLSSMIVNPDLRYRNFSEFSKYSNLRDNPDYRIDRGSHAESDIHKLIVIFQLTYIGAPMLYYGDEVGMTGANDPDCRKPMLWDDIVYEDEKTHPVSGKTRPVEKNYADKKLLEHYKKLIDIRKNNASLRRGSFRAIYIDDVKDVYGFLREWKTEKIIVFINNSKNIQNVEFFHLPFFSKKFVDVLNSNREYIVSDDRTTIKINPKWALILKNIK